MIPSTVINKNFAERRNPWRIRIIVKKTKRKVKKVGKEGIGSSFNTDVEILGESG